LPNTGRQVPGRREARGAFVLGSLCTPAILTRINAFVIREA